MSLAILSIIITLEFPSYVFYFDIHFYFDNLMYGIVFVGFIVMGFICGRYFIATNATSTFRSIVSSYPGELVLVSIQVEQPNCIITCYFILEKGKVWTSQFNLLSPLILIHGLFA